MAFPHAALRTEEMLRHSELGYRLLPGNSFAVSNYMLHLERFGRPPAERIPLAIEGIEADSS